MIFHDWQTRAAFRELAERLRKRAEYEDRFADKEADYAKVRGILAVAEEIEEMIAVRPAPPVLDTPEPGEEH